MLNAKSKFAGYVVEFLALVVGTFFMAFSTDFFLLPNKLSTGGFSGLSTIAYYIFHIPAGTAMIVLNIPLFTIAFLKLGKKFVIKTIIGTLLLSFFINWLMMFKPLTNDRFLACIYGGIIMGIGTSIVLKVDSSTGGSDLFSYIIRFYNNRFKSSDIIITIDTIIIAISMIIFKEIEIGLYSAIAIYLMGKMIDIVFEGINFKKVLLIISDRYEEIAEIVGISVKRGSTAIYARGMHSDENKMVLFCVGSRNEIIEIKRIATSIDNKAFIVIFNAREVLGKGFSSLNST